MKCESCIYSKSEDFILNEILNVKCITCEKTDDKGETLINSDADRIDCGYYVKSQFETSNLN